MFDFRAAGAEAGLRTRNNVREFIETSQALGNVSFIPTPPEAFSWCFRSQTVGSQNCGQADSRTSVGVNLGSGVACLFYIIILCDSTEALKEERADSYVLQRATLVALHLCRKRLCFHRRSSFLQATTRPFSEWLPVKFTSRSTTKFPKLSRCAISFLSSCEPRRFQKEKQRSSSWNAGFHFPHFP